MGVYLLPVDPGPFPSVIDRAVHTGMLEALMCQYTRALFEERHPGVKVTFVPFEMWGEDFRAVLAVSLASGKAPALYVARDLPGSARQGLFADITHLVEEWDQAHLQPPGAVAHGYIDGRYYVVAGSDLSSMVIRYRKDWFEEAGIYNEYGEPGPPTDWTWEDFRRIARQLTDPEKRRWGYADRPWDFGWTEAHGLMYYIPDRTGERTWRFNDEDPRLYQMLESVREMVLADRSVMTGASIDWYQWHQEFDAGRAGMIPSWAPHVPTQMLQTPYQFGRDKPYGESVGMAPPPRGPQGLRNLTPVANIYGFNPNLSKEELRAAFEWVTDALYGDMLLYNLRISLDRKDIYGRGDIIYRHLLISPYQPAEEIKPPKPLHEVFPADYIRTYDEIKTAPAMPLPRAFGLTEPASQEYDGALRAMFSEVLSSPDADVRAIVGKTADVINTNVLNFKDQNDREKLREYYLALGAYYRDNFPEFYRTVWPGLLERYYKVW